MTKFLERCLSWSLTMDGNGTALPSSSSSKLSEGLTKSSSSTITMGILLSCHRPIAPNSKTRTDNIMSTECKLCTEEMTRVDTQYPIKCKSSQCQFNACLKCTKQLLNSKKNGRQEASDGNMFVLRLDTSCPDCRAPFQVSLSDIVVLRDHASQSSRLRSPISSRRSQVPTDENRLQDSQLTAKELREKYLECSNDDGTNSSKKNKQPFWKLKRSSKQYQMQVQLAQNRYDNEILDSSSVDTNSLNTLSSPPSPLHFSTTAENTIVQRRIAYIQSKLYAGWEHVMSPAEQEFLQSLMTSGCTESLAQAAEILASLSQMKDSISPPRTARAPGEATSFQPCTTAMSGTQKPLARTTSSSLRGRSTGSLHSSRSNASFPRSSTSGVQREYAQRRSMEQLYPFPVRMPVSLQLPLDFSPYDLSASLTFVDDDSFYDDWKSAIKCPGNRDQKEYRLRLAWVIDAYQRLAINFWKELVRSDCALSIGVEHVKQGVKRMPPIQKDGKHETAVTTLDPMPWRRVVVSSVKGPISGMGVRAGDVVTHLDGERFRGNSDALRASLEMRRKEGERRSILSGSHLVFNAEPGTAYALRILSYLAATDPQDQDDIKV